MSGNTIKPVTERIAIADFDPEHRECMERAIEGWLEHEEQLLRVMPERHRRERTQEDRVWAFAYWLFRYSNLVRPAQPAEANPGDQDHPTDPMCWLGFTDADSDPRRME
jgi:hypothetical protein